MVTPLEDLQNRINSNTLTLAQQQALSESLSLVIPTFPSPDEQSGGIPPTEAALARAWMASLYAINGEGTSGGSAVLPTNQTVWHINATTGSNTNNGLTSGTALQTAAYLALLWKGTAGGGRPQLVPSTGSKITVSLDSDLPASDPISVLLDVDLGPDVTLVIQQGTAKTPARVGALATASTFARTHAGGQQTFTDVGVADYHTFIGTAMLMTDTTAPRQSVAWLVGPDPGSSATGTSSVFYTPQVAGTLSIPTIVQPLAADGYTLQAPTKCFLGSGFTTRQFPQVPQSGTDLSASVVFYRLELGQSGDGNVAAAFQGATSVAFVAQECQFDQGIQVQPGAGLTLVNCLQFHTTGVTAFGGATCECFAGACSNGTGAGTGAIIAEPGGIMVADLDFALLQTSGSLTTQGGPLELGNVSHWGTSSWLVVAELGGEVIINPIFGATAVVYGSDGGTFASVGVGTQFGAARMTYPQTGSGTPAADTFKSTNTAFLLGRGPSTSAWGVSATTGLAVGATTCTIAHLDAAIGAGTGFGSTAVDPATMSYVSVNA